MRACVRACVCACVCVGSGSISPCDFHSSTYTYYEARGADSSNRAIKWSVIIIQVIIIFIIISGTSSCCCCCQRVIGGTFMHGSVLRLDIVSLSHIN